MFFHSLLILAVLRVWLGDMQRAHYSQACLNSWPYTHYNHTHPYSCVLCQPVAALHPSGTYTWRHKGRKMIIYIMYMHVHMKPQTLTDTHTRGSNYLKLTQLPHLLLSQALICQVLNTGALLTSLWDPLPIRLLWEQIGGPMGKQLDNVVAKCIVGYLLWQDWTGEISTHEWLKPSVLTKVK